MILELDAGNTRIKWRLRNGQTVVQRGALATEQPLPRLDEYLRLYSQQIEYVWIASVLGETKEAELTHWCEESLSLTPQFARSSVVCAGVTNGYVDPLRLGVDRWLAMVAAYQLTQSATIILSMGTAATIDVIDDQGCHQGGCIGPGLGLMLETLVSKTQQIVLSEALSVLDNDLGRSTAAAICGGCTSMLMGFVDNAIKQYQCIAGNKSFELIFTGGDGAKLMPFYPNAKLINELVLDGLVYVMQGTSRSE